RMVAARRPGGACRPADQQAYRRDVGDATPPPRRKGRPEWIGPPPPGWIGRPSGRGGELRRGVAAPHPAIAASASVRGPTRPALARVRRRWVRRAAVRGDHGAARLLWPPSLVVSPGDAAAAIATATSTEHVAAVAGAPLCSRASAPAPANAVG